MPDQTTTVPTLTTTDDAITFMNELAETNDWVSVFWDRGWGDSGQVAEISIIVDGNGQQPKALITAEVYAKLLRDGVIPPNSLRTYKARRLHDFKTPPEPDAADDVFQPKHLAEGLCREMLRTVTNIPLAAEFGYFPDRERIGNSLRPQDGYVLMIPAASEVIVSPHLGWDLPSNPGTPGGAISVPYPADPAEIPGVAYRAELDAAIRTCLDAIETFKASR